MKETALPQPKIQTGLNFKGIVAILIILSLTVGGYFAYNLWTNYQVKAQQANILAQQNNAQDMLAERLGVHITQVSVTAEGGLIDFRYQVVDPDKAKSMFDYLEMVPRIIAENGTEISLTSVPHRHDVQSGIQYFLLYRNIGGSVKPGSEVSIALGKDIRLNNFKVMP
jgi:hypothetical protein